MVDTETRDSIGHRDQTKDLVFAGVINEKLRVKVVNEVFVSDQITGFILGHPTMGILGSGGLHGLGLNSNDKIEILRRQWNWKNYDNLKSNSKIVTLAEPGVEANITTD